MSREQIEPVGFETPAKQSRQFSFGWLRLAIPASLLLMMAVFVLHASSLRIQVNPSVASVKIAGPWPQVQLGDRWLLRPGEYRISALAQGYQLSETALQVQRGSQAIQLQLQPLPGLLEVDVSPDIKGTLSINGNQLMTFEGDFVAEIPPGTQRLEIDGELYSSWSGEIQVEGFGQRQQLEVALESTWSTARIVTRPAGAEVLLDGQDVGASPIEIPLEWGLHQLLIEKASYYPLQQEFNWQQDNQQLGEFELVPREVPFRLSSEPAGATVTLNGQYLGQTPLQAELVPLQQHQLRISRAGFRTLTTAVELPLGEPGERSFALEPMLGRVVMRVQPESAIVYVNGEQIGAGSQSLELPAATQRIRVAAPGFESTEQQVIPNPEIDQVLNFQLLTEEQARWANLPDTYLTQTGDEMLLFREPGLVRLGSDRSETERRANEARWTADLQRSIYVSRTMVTNRQFRAFSPDHSSGNFSGLSLDGAEQPVVNLDWQQAALYCNWLSEQEGLEPFYSITRGFVSEQNPQSNGYRLMTEAEWVWLAATTESGLRRKYAWGNTEAPQPVENFAGSETADLLNFYLDNLSDSHQVSSPVGTYEANPRNLFDLAGNAAEWIHDWYDPVPYPDDEPQVDPLGPDIGEFHVIRGSSWARGYQPQLRLAYRDYGATARNDVGFRVVRYAQ